MGSPSGTVSCGNDASSPNGSTVGVGGERCTGLPMASMAGVVGTGMALCNGTLGTGMAAGAGVGDWCAPAKES